jgi:glycosyltransferase involved in cell wall biosynthesis
LKRYCIGMVAACPFPAAFASSGLIREMACALKTRGHDVHVVTYHLGNSSFPLNDIPVHRIPNVPGYQKVCSGIALAKPFLDLLLVRTLYKASLQFNFDIIHTHNYEAPPAGYYVRRKLDIPVIYHAHNTMIHELPSYFKSVFMQSVSRKFGHYLDHVIPHKADHVITVSDDQTRYLASIGVPTDRMSMILPCIDDEPFKNGDGTPIRNTLGIGNAPLLIYTGGLQRYQNCKLLINLLKLCLSEEADTHLLVIARSESKDLKLAAESENVLHRVHFLQGKCLSFEINCLAAATIGVIPRLHCIGFPIKLLNYAAAGVPTVCFESLRKNFVHEKDILTAPDGDVRGMAEQIIRLIRNPRLAETLIVNAKDKIRKHHRWSSALSQIESIYDRLDRSRET